MVMVNLTSSMNYDLIRNAVLQSIRVSVSLQLHTQKMLKWDASRSWVREATRALGRRHSDILRAYVLYRVVRPMLHSSRRLQKFRPSEEYSASVAGHSGSPGQSRSA